MSAYFVTSFATGVSISINLTKKNSKNPLKYTILKEFLVCVEEETLLVRNVSRLKANMN